MMLLDQIVKIGEYQFVTSPGVVLRRKVVRNPGLLPVLAIASFGLSIHDAVAHSWFTAGFQALIAAIWTREAYKGFNALPDQTELIVERDGRWVVRGEDAGEAEGASVLVKTSGRRHLVLLSCRDRDKPHLIWWTLKRPDAERLRDVIETILPTRAGSGVWPPAPAYREND